jgi:predicted esterase
MVIKNLVFLDKLKSMQRLFYTVIFLSLFILPGKATDCFNGRYKNKVFTEYTLLNNVFYARKQTSDGRWQNLVYDVYQPKNDTASNRPVVILAHGGGYIDITDQKGREIVVLAIDLVQRGYVVISLEYREEEDPFVLFSEKKMLKAVARSLIDIRDATCSIMDTTLNYGNPYKIDYSKVIVGGISAGSISFLQTIFLDSLSWLPARYQNWILEVEPNFQARLNNKYCGANILGMINISGAILDTAWIKPNRVYPAMLSQHGTADPIVPYNYGHPLNFPFLPKFMGSFLIDKRYKDLGLRSEFQSWNGYSHLAFTTINLAALFGSGSYDDIYINPFIMDSTKRHIANFCYSLIDCDERVTGIRENIINVNLSIFPNPSTGNFTISIPKNINTNNCKLEMYDISGKQVFAQQYQGNKDFISINEGMPTGLYMVKMYYEQNNEKNIYIGKITIAQ